MSAIFVYLGLWLGCLLLVFGLAELLLMAIDRAADALARRDREGWK
jgi:hypothetical protein